MKAIVYHRYGPPDVLSVQEVPDPIPKPNAVLVKVAAAEVTKADCELRSFNFPVKWFALPLRLFMGVTKPRNPILGGYYSGVVQQCGAHVSMFKKGDKVFGSAGFGMGAYGELLCVPENSTMTLMPAGASFEQAAALPLGGLNALHFMNKAKIKPGMNVLINGAGGSIGSYALQIAKARGAHVTAVDSGIKEAAIRNIGADEFIDYQQQSVSSLNQKFDVIFDTIASSDYRRNLSMLTDDGHFLTANPRVSVMFRCAFTNRFSKKTATFAFAEESLIELNSLKDLFEQGELTPMLDEIIPMADVVKAHQRVETEQRLGIVVLSITPDVEGTEPHLVS